MKIFITGGSGSLGSEICKQLVLLPWVSEICVFSRHELSQFILKEEIESNKIKMIMGDILDFNHLESSSRGYDVMIHAAAIKHIDVAEKNPIIASEINVMGTANIVRVARSNNISQTIMISTDKASNPSNVYGYSKKIGESIVINSSSKENKMCVIRFGNIIGSSGSIFERWEKQKLSDKKITITHKDMTRFFISKKEAALYAISKINSFEGSEMFVPKMKSAKVYDIALRLSGGEDKMQYIGLRPGEKLHETVLSENEIGTLSIRDSELIVTPGNEKIMNVSSDLNDMWITNIEDMLE